MGVNFAAREPLAPLRDNGGGCIVNWKSSARPPAPDLHAFFVQGRHAGPAVARDYVFPRDCFAISPGLMRSKSRGYLRLESAAPGGRIEIQPNLLREPSDVRALAEAVEFCMELAATPPLAAFAVRPVSPNRRLSRSEREAFVRQACDTFFHTCGTCAMGSRRGCRRRSVFARARHRRFEDCGCLGYSDHSIVQHERARCDDRRARC